VQGVVLGSVSRVVITTIEGLLRASKLRVGGGMLGFDIVGLLGKITLHRASALLGGRKDTILLLSIRKRDAILSSSFSSLLLPPLLLLAVYLRLGKFGSGFGGIAILRGVVAQRERLRFDSIGD